MSPMARLVSLTILTVLIVFLGITFFHVIAPFLLPLFLAGVTAILCQPLFRYYVDRTGNRARLAAGLTTASVLFILLTPLLVGTILASLQLYELALDTLGGTDLKTAGTTLQSELIDRIRPLLPQDVETEQIRQNVQRLLQSLAERSFGLAGTTLNRTLSLLAGLVSLLVGLFMFVIALYYFLADGPALLSATEGLIPVHLGYQRELRSRFEEVVRAVVMATFLSAIAQGLATALALYAVGWYVDSELLRHFFIISVVAMLAALIPVSGSWLVWGPCAIWCLLNGYWATAILLTLFGAAVIGTMDNLIRTYVLQSDARLHPLLAFISVLGGLQVLGLWGVFIGPIVASCLHALVKIFNVELKELSKEKFALLTTEKPQTPDESVDASAEQTDKKPPADDESKTAEETVDADDDAREISKAAVQKAHESRDDDFSGDDGSSKRDTRDAAEASTEAKSPKADRAEEKE